jgi:hypothetical protein
LIDSTRQRLTGKPVDGRNLWPVSRTGRSRNRPVRTPVSQIRGHPCAEAGKAFNKQALRAGSVARSPGRGRCLSSPRAKQERARRANWAGSIRLCRRSAGGLARAFGVILHRRPLGRGAARMTVALGRERTRARYWGRSRSTFSSGPIPTEALGMRMCDPDDPLSTVSSDLSDMVGTWCRRPTCWSGPRTHSSSRVVRLTRFPRRRRSRPRSLDSRQGASLQGSAW